MGWGRVEGRDYKLTHVTRLQAFRFLAVARLATANLGAELHSHWRPTCAFQECEQRDPKAGAAVAELQQVPRR